MHNSTKRRRVCFYLQNDIIIGTCESLQTDAGFTFPANEHIVWVAASPGALPWHISPTSAMERNIVDGSAAYRLWNRRTRRCSRTGTVVHKQWPEWAHALIVSLISENVGFAIISRHSWACNCWSVAVTLSGHADFLVLKRTWQNPQNPHKLCILVFAWLTHVWQPRQAPFRDTCLQHPRWKGVLSLVPQHIAMALTGAPPGPGADSVHHDLETSEAPSTTGPSPLGWSFLVWLMF